jgi:GTP-binding protein
VKTPPKKTKPTSVAKSSQAIVAPVLDPQRIVTAEFFAGAQDLSQMPAPTLLEVVFAGRSNVGKSSLMNGLCGRRNLVKTSSTPGCTRQVSFFHVKTADAVELHLVDLPGYGYAKRSKAERRQWGSLIEGYLLERPTLRVVVALVDVRRGPEEDDEDLLELLRSEPRTNRPPLELLTVGTKLDRLPLSQRKLAVQELKQKVNTALVVSGIELPDTQIQVWRKIRSLAGL